MPDSEERRPYGYYGILIAVYNLLFGIFLLLYRKKENKLDHVTGLDAALLGLATLRMAKMVSEDEITAVIRNPLVEVKDGERRPRGRGLRWSLGKLVLCPNCTGTWIAAFLTYSLHLFPKQTRPFLAVMSASGASQFSDAVLSLIYTDRDLLRDEEQIVKETRQIRPQLGTADQRTAPPF
jgi:hypothetical protein